MRRSLRLIGLVILTVLGCTVTSRDRLKHFFFEIPAKDAPLADDDRRPTGTVVPVEDQLTWSLPPARFVSIHEPFRARDCQACHDADQRMTVDDDTETTCGSCHERYFSDEVGHGPVGGGECLLCHDPHRSAFRALLTTSVSDNCAECHDVPEDLSQPAHAESDATNCVRCHDPHFGEPPLLKPTVK